VGLPMRRERIFILMLRKDLYDESDLDEMVSNIKRASTMVLCPRPLDGFIMSADSEEEFCEGLVSKRRRSAAHVMTEKSEKASDAFRKEFGLVARRSASGQPFSSTADRSTLQSFTARELEVMDCADLYCRKFMNKSVNELAVDVSNTFGRKPWRANGEIPSPSTSSKLVVAGKLVGLKSMFMLMGWPRGSFRLPSGLSHSCVQTLLGNMLCPPVVGTVCAGILAADKHTPWTRQKPFALRWPP